MIKKYKLHHGEIFLASTCPASIPLGARFYKDGEEYVLGRVQDTGSSEWFVGLIHLKTGNGFSHGICYSGCKFTEEQINKIACGTMHDWEIVVDD
jgi:hypothetical protein